MRCQLQHNYSSCQSRACWKLLSSHFNSSVLLWTYQFTLILLSVMLFLFFFQAALFLHFWGKIQKQNKQTSRNGSSCFRSMHLWD